MVLIIDNQILIHLNQIIKINHNKIKNMDKILVFRIQILFNLKIIFKNLIMNNFFNWQVNSTFLDKLLMK